MACAEDALTFVNEAPSSVLPLKNYELIYFLEIIPLDKSHTMAQNQYLVFKYITENIAIIKQDSSKTVVNEDAIAKHYAERGVKIRNSLENFYPVSLISILNYYISDFKMEMNGEEYAILIQYFDFKNPQDISPELLETDYVIGSSKVKMILNLVMYHCVITLCLSHSVSNYLQFIMGEMIADIEYQPSQFYNLREIPLDAGILRTKLFPNQIDNINKMLDMVRNPQIIHIHNSKVYEVCGLICLFYDTLKPIAEKYPTDITKLKPYKLAGTLLCDDVGIGKTIQALVFWMAFKMYQPESTCLVIVPSHLETHWKIEITKHFGMDCLPGMTIINLSKVVEYLATNKPSVMIVDEFHELYDLEQPNLILSEICNYNAVFKIAITATPIIDNSSLKKIIDFLICSTRTSELIGNYPYARNQIKQAFIRKTKDSIKDTLVLPEVTVNNTMIDMLADEAAVYNAESSGFTNTSRLLEIAADVYLKSSERDDGLLTIRPADFRHQTMCEMQREFDNAIENISKLEAKFAELLVTIPQGENIDTISKTSSLYINIQKLQQSKDQAKEYAERRKVVLERYKESVAQIDAIMKQFESSPPKKTDESASLLPEDTNCQVCYGEFTAEGIAWFRKCGHYCCIGCFHRWDKSSRQHKCFQCRTDYESSDIQLITEFNITNVGSKIKEVLRLVIPVQGTERFIIYSQYDRFVVRLMNILKRFGIRVITIDDLISSDCGSLDYDVVLLSSKRNASGLDLSHINNVIIMDPFENYTYCRAIEKQLVGRVHRIGQTKPVNVYRLIMKGTIEELIYSA